MYQKVETIALRGSVAPQTKNLQVCNNVIRFVCTGKKEKENFPHIFKEIHIGAVAKSYMRKGFLMYEELRIYEEAVSHI